MASDRETDSGFGKTQSASLTQLEGARTKLERSRQRPSLRGAYLSLNSGLKVRLPIRHLGCIIPPNRGARDIRRTP